MRRSAGGNRRRFSRDLAVVLVLAAAALAAFAIGRLQPPAAPLTGRAAAVDGDTIRLGPTRIRLLGLDAPELDQDCTDARGNWPCGAQARSFVAAALARRTVSCARLGRDVYGRTLSRCAVSGADLGQAIVAAGWAVSTDAYAAEQASARSAGLGIWSGSFVMPAQWRRSHGVEPAPWDWIRSWF